MRYLPCGKSAGEDQKAQVDQEGAESRCGHVYDISPEDSRYQGNLVEYHLLGGVVGGDVEHVNVGVRPGGPVDEKGDEAADQKQGQSPEKSPAGPAGEGGEKAGDPGENQDKMPDEAVEGQSNVGVHEPAGFRQGHKAPQKPEILQKSGGSPASSFWEQGEDQAQVHGDAAQLKGKIPPVVDSGVGHQSEKELLVHLADSQDQAAQKQAADGIPAPAAEKDCQADGKGDPCQAEKYVKKGIGFRRRHGPCGQLQKSGYHSCSPWN